jgi:hypothetical protein
LTVYFLATMLTCYIFYNLLFYWLLPVSKRVSSLVNLHLTHNRTKCSGSLPNLGLRSCFILRFCVLPVYPKIVQNCKFSSGKFSILTKFWISFKLHLNDPKSHGDYEYLVYLVGSSMAKALSLTSGILPENLH